MVNEWHGEPAERKEADVPRGLKDALAYGEGPRHAVDADKLPGYTPRQPARASTERSAVLPATEPPEDEPHEYERGETSHKMHTEPLCRVCGQPRKSVLHR